MQSACRMAVVSVSVGCGKRRSFDRWSLDGDRDTERVKPGLIGVVAIPGLSCLDKSKVS